MLKKYKLIGWYVLIALLAWGMWGAGTSLHFDSITGLNINLSVTGLFLLLVSLSVIGYALFRSRWVPLISSLIIGLSFIAWFGMTKLNFLGLAVLILFAYESYRRTGRQTQRIKISPTEILRHGLYPMVVGIFLVTSFAAYQSPLAGDLEKTKHLPGQTQQFFREVADKFIGPRLDTTSAKERQYITGQVAAQAYQQVNGFLKPYFQYAPPLLAFGLFLILWGLSWFFVWLAVGVGAFLLWLMRKTKLVKVEEHEVKMEKLVI